MLDGWKNLRTILSACPCKEEPHRNVMLDKLRDSSNLMNCDANNVALPSTTGERIWMNIISLLATEYTECNEESEIHIKRGFKRTFNRKT